MPKAIKPMLATLIDEPFDDKEWIFEPKWDGYRAIADIHKKKIRLYSRNNQPFNQTYPKIIDALSTIKVDSVILDGEIVAVDSQGKQNFQFLQNFKKETITTMKLLVSMP